MCIISLGWVASNLWVPVPADIPPPCSSSQKYKNMNIYHVHKIGKLRLALLWLTEDFSASNGVNVGHGC